jgi:hypothetical protein
VVNIVERDSAVRTKGSGMSRGRRAAYSGFVLLAALGVANWEWNGPGGPPAAVATIVIDVVVCLYAVIRAPGGTG